MNERSPAFRYSALLLAVALAGCTSEPLPGDLREPRCEARGHTEPGRLNVDTDATRYGLAAPCAGTIVFYIARNTDLRSVSTHILLTNPDGTPVHEDQAHIGMESAGAGMYRTDYRLEPASGWACHDLAVDLEIRGCRGEHGTAITCPEVRVKTSMVFRDFLVRGDDLDLCFDD